jgi:hypothetical protein
MYDTHCNPGQEFEDLIFTLERSFDRSGVFYIGVLNGLQHEQVARYCQQNLHRKGILVDTFQLHHTSLQALDQRLQGARAKRERAILFFWSLEHLSKSRVRQTLRALCGAREQLSQNVGRGKTSVPVVFLVNQAIYQEYFGEYAMDLIDGVSHFSLRTKVLKRGIR